MPGLQDKGLDASIGVVGSLPQANLVARGCLWGWSGGCVCWSHHVRYELTWSWKHREPSLLNANGSGTGQNFRTWPSEL